METAAHKWLEKAMSRSLEQMATVRRRFQPALVPRETGSVLALSEGIAMVDGLPHVKAEELVRFRGDIMGMALNLDPGEVGVMLLDHAERIEAGDEVRRTGRVLDVPVGETLLGRVIDALGRPLDEQGPLLTQQRMPVEREAPAIITRAAVHRPLQTGIKVVDALVPVGRGQRELILGDRQTGKTAIAVDTILNQQGRDVLCIYCAVGKQKASVARVIADLKKNEAMAYTIVVVAGGDAPVGQQYIAPYAATSMGEYFMQQGRDVLIVYDDLTWHARAYRELSLLLRRPPGREAYPGDIFYLHSRLLERSTQLDEEHGAGSMTALPIIETQAQNLSAYIPTNLISITDGQIYLSPGLFQKGQLPAVDVGQSVSRVGGAAQLPAYRTVSGPLRLAYAQFQELEAFARFSTRLDDSTRKRIERGRRVREVLKQSQYAMMTVPEQFAVLLAVTAGLFDEFSLRDIKRAENLVRRVMQDSFKNLSEKIEGGEQPSEVENERLLSTLHDELISLFREE